MAAPEYHHLVDTQGNRGRLYDGTDAADAMAAWSKAVSEGAEYVTLESLRSPVPPGREPLPESDRARVQAEAGSITAWAVQRRDVPAPAAPSCDGSGGVACPERVAWLLAYECPAGHVTYRRYCLAHDGQQLADQYVTRPCGMPGGEATCAREAGLTSRRRPQR